MAVATELDRLISIHAPAKGATLFLSSHAILQSISIHAPAKGATYNLTNAGIVRLFQSTLPRRERQNGLQKIRKHMHFNPRSREGSDVVFIHWSFIVAYFNPRSREGSDEQSFPNLTELLTISIHAPAKGATGLFSLWKVDKIISIHAPAKGATAFINIFSLAVRLFFISSHQ